MWLGCLTALFPWRGPDLFAWSPVEELEYHGAVLLIEKGKPAANEEEKVVAFVINRIEATWKDDAAAEGRIQVTFYL